MLKLCIFLIICTLKWAYSDILKSPLRVELKPPVAYKDFARTVQTSWIDMPIDHFDPQNRDMYRMRYMYNEEFFGGNGYPVFILVGGEWDIDPSWLYGGHMFLMAHENRGYQIYTEHRYYGQSLPYTNFTTENLRFLNVDQALADLAYFISELKTSPKFANSKVILYGGSYAANMVIWFKQRYPHLVVGGIASSGPIKAEMDYFGYLEVVHSAFLSEGGEKCVNTIREGIADSIAAIETEAGRKLLQSVYGLCEPLDYNSRLAVGYFFAAISWTFSMSVQHAYPGMLTAICQNFDNNIYGETPMEQIAGYLAEARSARTCSDINYDNYVEMYRSTIPSNDRAWYYQTCTEYGFFQTAPRSGTVFDQFPFLDVQFYVDVCVKAYGERFNESFVRSGTERVNLMFGGLRPDVNNTINIHGSLDPWNAAGVLDRDLKDSSPTIVVPRATHCFDMGTWEPTDTIRMSNARQRARRLVSQWLS